MGCDIHLRVEKRVDGVWQPAEPMVPNKYYEPGDDSEPETVPDKFYSDRNYSLFAILANVRNGVGFAGCDTGDGFTPIAMPRGLPENVSTAVEKDSESWGGDGHSHSWLTLSEILTFDWTQTTKQRGWVDARNAEAWLRLREWDISPKEFCGGISGGSVRHISMGEMEQEIDAIKSRFLNKDRHDWKGFESALESELALTYAQAEWEIDYARCCKNFWFNTIPRLLRVSRPEHVRLVFWFDN